MTKTLYVKIESMIKLENMPSDYGASLTLDGYELGRGTFALPKYEEWQDTLTDWDYIQNTIVAVQDTMPADFNIAVSASGYITRLAWYEITVPNNYEPPPDLNGGGGENPPPEPPDPSTFAELYAGRWSDHWTDTDGLIHYYPQAGAFAELWQTSDEDALRGMLDAQMRILGPTIITPSKWPPMFLDLTVPPKSRLKRGLIGPPKLWQNQYLLWQTL